jgi:hypothetical protein
MLANVDRRRRSRGGRAAMRAVDSHVYLRERTPSPFLPGANVGGPAGNGAESLSVLARWRSLEIQGGTADLPFDGIGGDDGGVCGSGVPEHWVRAAATAGEALLFALHAAVKATSATAGLLHRVREPFIGLVTSSAHGPVGTESELGQVIPHYDDGLDAARAGCMVLGPKDGGAAERAIARRFAACGPTLSVVAMVPIFDGDDLMAMLELARADHPFRWSDADVLRSIAELVSAR